jgi:hypothetical protein
MGRGGTHPLSGSYRRFTRAGLPAKAAKSGYSPRATTEFAATRVFRPMRAPANTVTFRPMLQPEPIDTGRLSSGH